MSGKPCYCLGSNTIKRVANESQLETEQVNFVAADDLFHKDPYDQISQLTKERDELAAKCAEMRSVIQTINSNRYLLARGYDKELIDFIRSTNHALSDQCGEGWLSPEKKRELDEQHCMELAAVMTATLQNTESTIKDRIPKENPYWTPAYGDVCVAIDREMKLIKQKKVLVEALKDCIVTFGFMNPETTDGKVCWDCLERSKQALEACKI